MRLIDADEFMENLIYCDGLGRRGLEAVLKTLKEQPTAYDISKVVEELETLRIDKCNYFGVLNVVAEKYDRANEMLDDAIDIVRKGGVE